MFTNVLPINVMSFFGMLVGENTLEKWKKIDHPIFFHVLGNYVLQYTFFNVAIMSSFFIEPTSLAIG